MLPSTLLLPPLPYRCFGVPVYCITTLTGTRGWCRGSWAS